MSDEEWDADSFEPKDFKAPSAAAQWEGEDEDDNVKDNWEDEESEEKKEPPKTAEKPPAQVKKKKPLKDIKAEEKREPKTPQEIYEDKLQQQKLQEEADLLLAKETFGGSDTTTKFSIDVLDPSSKDDFENFRKAISEKVLKYERSPYFVSFLDDLFRDLCLGMDADDIKKINSTLNALCNEKVKAAKASKSKKKGSKRANLVVGRGDDFEDYRVDDYRGGDDFDDFI